MNAHDSAMLVIASVAIISIGHVIARIFHKDIVDKIAIVCLIVGSFGVVWFATEWFLTFSDAIDAVAG